MQLKTQMKNIGYRGYFNVDSVETENNIYFSEINARVPYSLYPAFFCMNQGAESFEVFEKQVKFDSDLRIITDGLNEENIVFFLREHEDCVIYRTLKYK